MRTPSATWKTLALVAVATLLATLTAGAGSGQALDKDETVLTVEVSSSDHELLEGYFTLGESTTVMAKPGSELYKFLARQRGRRIKVTLTETSSPELSRLDR